MATFEPGTKVLAYHGPLVYEAKVIESYEQGADHVTDIEGKLHPTPDKLGEELRLGHAYLLHYKGWKPKWDEWVLQLRVMAINEETLALQRELKQRLAKRKPLAATARASPAAGLSRDESRKKSKTSSAPSSVKSSRATLVSYKRKRATTTPEISLPMAPRLKYVLVDDWENITKKKTLVSVPAPYPVNSILKEYRASLSIPADAEDVVDEVLDGVRQYFDKCLGLILLYKFERLQYLDVLKHQPDGTPLSNVYGVEHLLRLFTALPGLVAQTTMDPVSINTLIDESKDLLDFIDNNLVKFTNGYINVTPGYENLAQ